MSMNSKRLAIGLAALIFGCLAFTVADAEPLTSHPQIQMQPIKDVEPFNSGDTYKVQVFFKFSCPVCRQYHLPLANWGATLPKPFKIEFEPILEADASGQGISKDSSMGMVMFWSMRDAGTIAQQTAFAEEAYGLVQDDNNGANPSAWMKAVSDAGVYRSNFTKGFEHERNNMVDRSARQLHYMPTVTPTMVICGKWIITPDSANGDENLFFKLANGLVSKCMLENGLHKG